MERSVKTFETHVRCADLANQKCLISLGKCLAQPEQFPDVDTHFFKIGRSTPLLLSWRSGAHITAKAMIEDVLTIRADSDLAAQKIHVYLKVFHYFP